MATSSGNTTISSSTSEENRNGSNSDERKRKRMESNRESARRSRMRKQQHLNDLTVEINRLIRENNQIDQTINVTNQQLVNVEAENSVLRAQMNELSQRLDSLNGIVNDINTLGGVGLFEDDGLGILGDFGNMEGYFGNFANNNIIGNNSWNSGFFNQQPIMASADVLQY
ncbi:hypothetical protein RND81_01G177400 [Saponaria officinalis]|uniref:BZIP domain-containing protein n=1 Tax=Saponaria officinalis TaxID=3572 RepID=A0AAW1NF45_SAPOF